MGPVDTMMWTNICACLPLTLLVICCVCRMLRREHVPVIYYTNVLISNLIQLIMLATWVPKLDNNEVILIHDIIYFFGVMASLYFKMCLALERYFFIACPLLDWIRQTKGSVLVCVLVWVLCIVSVPLAIVLQETLRLDIYGLLPAPLFIFCLAGTLKALPAATSVPDEEKQRVVGTLVLLLLNYFLMILPMIICHISRCHYYDFLSILFLLNPFVDLFFFVFLCSCVKGPLTTCCTTDNTVADAAAD